MRVSDPGLAIMAVSFFTACAYTIKVIANAFVSRSDNKRRMSESSVAMVSDERMARLESAVEAIAIEVERISEGQRFTTRLLTEQAQPIQAILPRPGKFDTPH